MILFVNGCVRENSRTLGLAKEVLSNFSEEIQEVCLEQEGPEGLNADTLNLRDQLISSQDYDHPMLRWAKQFAEADTIIMAAPYWDLMFPAKVRAYLEAVTVSGITFFYNSQGIPEGLCKAKKLIYVTTAGGPVFRNFAFEYVEALAHNFYGIRDVRLVMAEGLDIWGADTENIIKKAKEEAAGLVL